MKFTWVLLPWRYEAKVEQRRYPTPGGAVVPGDAAGPNRRGLARSSALGPAAGQNHVLCPAEGRAASTRLVGDVATCEITESVVFVLVACAGYTGHEPKPSEA